MTESSPNPRDYDALLVLSFGGPEKNEEVVPFLENVTRGRGIPRERLVEVGEHYFHFNGKSPLNELNLEIIDHVEKELKSRGIDMPVYFGNRNWHPLAKDTAEQMVEDGIRSALVFATSAWGGYSACRQYNEDIVHVEQHLEEKGLPGIDMLKLRHFFSHPAFIEENAKALTEAIAAVDADKRDNMRILFTAHSVPTAHDEVGGGKDNPHLYSRQVAEASRLVAEAAGIEEYDVVWQSRSGDPRTPWLEPDIVDHTEAIHAEDGVKAVVVCPIGFISDHMEVIWDLDTELVEAATELGVQVSRAYTVGPEDSFAAMIVDLVEEHTAGRTPEILGDVTVQGNTKNGNPCAAGCCDIWSLKKAKSSV
ncbi:ferrochelatase [Corynebacterium ammoniagenes]|uniref:Coproporphyrin III ferrochelatase n=1 Tax=Corynebacterium ammoniagenes DSM 20306 TaxID=649754 RepID=A0ABP2IFQ3_CORAM|nr:ferrochelatase [Corynebacterium ammoniagenes]APT82646.1 ferrochelatase [Corynebacterium ammoniagenes DSM 20306]AQS73711.1 ferrochelatase [Corynebacterium ammoniagenes]EFG82379.1 ferrochelatase [Corynebacterium ammoniagenes DSM 20306]